MTTCQHKAFQNFYCVSLRFFQVCDFIFEVIFFNYELPKFI